ncbi:hypothetical protein MN608_11122 [Microdochium nivale]|nr:hypothetical protein MN608_11122 [Microdochium nivale]
MTYSTTPVLLQTIAAVPTPATTATTTTTTSGGGSGSAPTPTGSPAPVAAGAEVLVSRALMAAAVVVGVFGVAL